MRAEPALAVEGLRFQYRTRSAPAIQDVTFELQPGEILLVAGASGCGKTTLARCVNGLIPRTYKGELHGQIRVFGEDTAAGPMARISQRVGTVLQDPERQILGTKVLLEVAFGLENLSLPRPEILDRVEEALHYLNVSPLRDRETFHLSGGEKQKVAVAGVLAMRPSILLLDEPLASLDPASAVETLQMVRRLADEGMAVLLIEHRVEDVIRIHPDRVLFMSDGRIRYLGPLEGMLSAVSHREVKLPAAMVMQKAAQEAAPVPLRARPIAAVETRRPLIRFEQVTFGYDDGPDILQSVSLDIHPGDVVGVLGPNGAGKTTLVKHAIGLLKPRAGRVLVNDLDTRQASVAQLAAVVGYVFQSPSHMLFAPSVNEELAFGPKNLGHPARQIEKEVREALEIVHLEDRGADSPLALSFGQQKRVSIAAILAMQSRLLVMDEPTAGQDYQNYMDFMDAILQMPAFEAIVFITHDVDLAVSYANRVLLMADGQVRADGPPHEVLRDLTLLEACRLVPTSLLQENLKRVGRTGRFLRAEALAHI
jgi:energy-coupling factor transport system ATP-binding protein